MGFVGWLLLAAGVLLVYSAVKGTSPLATTRAVLAGEPPPDPQFVIEPASSGGEPHIQGAAAGGAGALMMPLAGPVTSPHGPRWGTMHHGVDIAAGTGTPVRAAGAGTVTTAGWNAGYGQYVRIRHSGDLETAYGHMSNIAVSRGATVSQGQTVGEVGSTGESTGPHLHFEVWADGESVDPLQVIGSGAVTV